MKKFERILILTDKKKSSSNQTSAVKKYLMNSIKSRAVVKNMEITDSRIPNILIWFFLKINLIKPYKELIDFVPDLVISCGRVTAPFSAILKKNTKCKNIHIFKPYIRKKLFDLILIPEHDRYSGERNVIRFNGALVNQDKFKFKSIEKKEFLKIINPPVNKELVTVLIGGDNKSQSYTEQEIEQFIILIEKLQKEKKYFLCFLFSRRTPLQFKLKIERKFSKFCFVWNEKEHNPFWYLLSTSDYIIVTGDSISMTCEAIESKNPVFVYIPQGIKKKFKQFHNNNFINGYTKKFKGKLDKTFPKKKKFQNDLKKQLSEYFIK